MNSITGSLRSKISLGAAIVLFMSVSATGSAWASYPPDGTKPDGVGHYRNPDDGMCVIGIKVDGTMLVDWSITNARDCVAYTKSANGSVNLASMTTSDMCTKAGFAGNDGYKHAWTTSLCYDTATSKGISRVDLDNTDAMCLSKGGKVLGSGYCTGAGVPFACCSGAGTGTCGACVAFGWQYLNRKADGSLPVTGTGIDTTQGPTNPSDGLGFCYVSVNLTGGGIDGGTFTSAASCPSKHNSRLTADPVGGPYAEWPDCQSTAAGCQTQTSYDAGLGWSFASSQCRYAYGLKGKIPTAVTNAAGTATAAGTAVDLSTGYETMGKCLGAGFSWDNWLPVVDTSTKDNTSGGEYAGMPANTVLVKLDALTNVEDGGGDFYSGTGAVCQKCHSDQSRSYMERNKPGYPETRHKLAGDALGTPFQPYFTSAASDWGLTGVQCAMCHSTGKPALDDLIQVQPAGYSSNQNLACTALRTPYSCCTGPGTGTCTTITEGTPKSAAGHNNTEYGTHLVDICYTCHGTPAIPIETNPASVIPVASGDFANTSKGLSPIANQFLNSPHAKYIGGSSKVDVGNKDKYGSSFEGWVCRTPVTQFRSSSGLVGENATTCAAGGYTWYTTTGFGSFCYYNNSDAGASCVAAGGQWTTTFDTSVYRWASAAGGPGGVCYGTGQGSIITTVYRNGVAEKIHNLDSTINTTCTNPADGSATSGAAGYWVRDGETSPGTPATTDQGNCMTCHDVHWALASTNPEAEPLRRECTTCHSNSGPSATGAPQINLATINHLGGVGTPLEHSATEPATACESCHMPKSAANSSFMHLWRINTDPNYVTLTGTQVPLDASGNAWVDLDHACGQCHGGGTVQDATHQPVPPALYRTRAALAGVAVGMHASSGQNYGVTFSRAVSGLTASVNATVDCGDLDPNNPDAIDPTCPAGITYDWNWGDNSGHGSGDPASHLYPAPTCVSGSAAGTLCSSDATCTGGGTCALQYQITLIVNLNGQHVGAPVTQGVIVSPPDLPPVAGGVCTWAANSWTMQLVDSSTDPPGPPPHVVIDWGDGTRSSVVAGGTISKVYTRIGSFPVTVTASDTLGQSNTVACGTASPAYFTIGGTVRNALGAVLPGAVVTLKKRAPNGTFVNFASAATSTTGAYSFGSIKPGRYSITVTKSGYAFGSATETDAGPNQTIDVSATAPTAVLSPKVARRKHAR